MKRKLLQLNKTIMITAMVGYMAILCLLLLMDFYLIRNYQTEGRRREKEALQAYIDKTAEAMTDIDHEIYEVYTNNPYFQALQEEETEVDNFGNAYELRETLQYRSLVEEDIGGFFIYYDEDFGRSLYYTKDDKITQGNGISLNKVIRENLENTAQIRHWVSVCLNGSIYQAIIYRGRRAAVAGVYSMENLITLADEQTDVILMENGLVYGSDRELAEELKLARSSQENEDAFQKKIRNYQVCGMRVPNTELWVYTVYPRTLGNVLNIQQVLLLLVTLLSVSAVGVMYRFMRKEIVHPIHRLTETMDMIKKHENQDIPPLESRFVELQEMNQTLEEMIRELEQQKLVAYEEIIERQKAQMQYLQLQLKPHFYLNGLKTLNALAVERQTDKIQELIMNLSRHLRYLLQVENEVVPLEQELQFVQNYIELQKHMTGRPVTMGTRIDEKAIQWPVPTLLIQTFVENSVKYAQLGGGSIPLMIEVTADCLETEDGECLDLIIRDNGHGYPEDILEEINADPKIGSKSVGINNVKRRCHFLYGEKAEYYFETDGGAVSEIIVPFVKGE